MTERDFSKRNMGHLRKALEHVNFLNDISENLNEEYIFNLLKEFNHKYHYKGSFIFKYGKWRNKLL
jgi:hypothetical protein